MATNTKTRLYRPDTSAAEQSDILKDMLSNMDMDELAKEQPN
jgi:hypothetical protein